MLRQTVDTIIFLRQSLHTANVAAGNNRTMKTNRSRLKSNPLARSRRLECEFAEATSFVKPITISLKRSRFFQAMFVRLPLSFN